MTSIAIPHAKIWLPRFEPWRLLKPLRIDGQWSPRQRLQFIDADPGVHSRGADTELTFSYVAFEEAGGSGTTTCLIPATAAAGDLCIFLDGATASSTPTKVIPGDFTELVYISYSNGVLTGSYRVLDSDDPNTTRTGNDGNFDTIKAMIVFRPSRAIVSTTPGGWLGRQTNNNPAIQTVAASAVSANKPVLVIGASMSQNGASFSFSPAGDGSVGTGDREIHYKFYNSGGSADHTIDQSDTGNGNGQIGGYFSFT